MHHLTIQVFDLMYDSCNVLTHMLLQKQERQQSRQERAAAAADREMPKENKADAVVAAEEPYRQLLADEVDDDSVTAAQPRKRLLNFKIPLLHKGAQRRGQGVSVITRRRGTAPQSPTIVQPRGIVVWCVVMPCVV